eukprot:CAMPEP_0183501930 /NCGR_PEP_ID=MMETSP0371-20130417/3849_1 /TAXON_ID=268820 /ORGANISM="Peridinium aciculiferum, Strain PAER-2" /LENGTH=33 /DNA_ID= /DNA_START= /DNA_END= /DNA_ORIENTATION=
MVEKERALHSGPIADICSRGSVSEKNGNPDEFL